jgi:hypothetical protein
MNKHKYTVIFVSGAQMEVEAFCSEEAIILAQAERIKAGLSYDVLKVEREVQHG